MTDSDFAELVSFIQTTIGDCGSASEGAELAARLKKIADYQDSSTLRIAYHILREWVLTVAGVGRDYSDQAIDEAISRFLE